MKLAACIVLVAVVVASARADTGITVCDYACPAISDPVCGSDGVTYSNACYLSLAACNSKSGTTQVSDGECPAACDYACPAISDPVCGSDGVTYSNACYLSLAACNSKSGTTQVSDGECPAACDYACPAISDPVCGSDGVTYSNACYLSLAACNSKSGTTQVSEGECASSIGGEASADEDVASSSSSSASACPDACPDIFSQVCGSDGVTYSNPCLLSVASCLHPELTITEAADDFCSDEDASSTDQVSAC